MARLKAIVDACGGVLLDGGARALIPGPGHSGRDRSVSLRETEDGRILIHTFSARDDWRSVRQWLAEQGLLGEEGGKRGVTEPRRSPPAVQPDGEARTKRARRIWEEGRPIAHTLAGVYLEHRAIDVNGAAAAALRFHPGMTSLDDRLRRPALTAAIADPLGQIQGVQVTLLSAHGRAKASLTTPRRVIGNLMGGAVRLGEPEGELAIGEGVETMMSASSALGLPAYAALTADNLAAFVVPRGIKRLVIAADNDGAGLAAAEKLAIHTTDCAVELALPPDGASDWNAWAMLERQRHV